MDFKAEDFPLYQHLVNLGQPGVEQAMSDFKAACKGGDTEKYKFAFGIQTIATNVPIEVIPGLTKEINEVTLRSCLAVFKAVADGNSAEAVNAKFMVADFKRRGFEL